MPSEERAELEGVTLDGRYEVGRRIGVGGTGVVFAATRLADRHPVVVKTLRPVFSYNADLNRRLRRELEVSRRVAHPGIVPIIDEGRIEDGSPYLVMERIYGEPLNRLLRRVGPLGVNETLAIARRVCDVLHRAHANGYVHRDVKPEHIVLDRSPSGDLKVWLLDFGVCASATAPSDERERERGRVFGTPSYVSPEQACGNPDVDARADIFGLGVVLFECLSGRVPFTGTTVTNLLRRVIREDAPRVGLIASHVGRELDAVIARMLARDRDQRFSSARGLARALAAFVPAQRATERHVAANIRAGSFPPDAQTTLQEQAAPELSAKRYQAKVQGARVLAAALGL